MLTIYYGAARGKTTLCIGAALIAAERERSVLYVRYRTSSDNAADPLRGKRNITVISLPVSFDFDSFDEAQLPQLSRIIRELFDNAVRLALTTSCGLLVLDDVFDMTERGLLPQSEVYDFLSNVPDSIEVICTGRGADEKYLKLADSAVELRLFSKDDEGGVV